MLPGIILGLFVVAGVVVGFEVKFWKRVYPGVVVSGINLTGKNESESVGVIKKQTEQIKDFNLNWGTNSWTISLADIGVRYNPEATFAKAYQVGRSGVTKNDFSDKLTGLTKKFPINLIYTLDENKLTEALNPVTSQINIPAREPEVIYDKNTGKIDVTPGENGQAIDEKRLVDEIKLNLTQVSSQPIEIPVLPLLPKLNDEQLELARQRATKLVGKKIVINFPEEEQKWELTDEELMTWLAPSGGWKNHIIETWVAELATTVDRPAQNANFQFVSPGRVQEFKPAKEGFKIRQEELSQKILAAVTELGPEKDTAFVDLVVEKVDPSVKTSEVNDLGIKELLGKGESWFSGSIDNRIFNLQKATAILNGILVAPGEIFSFNQALGEISSKTGYKQAYVIKEGKTILGDGGGVCQTSTTLFRAVLAAGLPITERIAHAYRVHYYEEKYQVGFDATVFQPSPDFKFKNDTPAYILIQTSVDLGTKKLTYEIYGTSDGRKAEISKSRTWEVTPPPPDLYIDDPNLQAGVVRQTEHAAWGAKVAFDWKVTRGEEVLQQRTFYSNYAPWQAVYLRGTKI